jgi:hypothetical protein
MKSRKRRAWRALKLNFNKFKSPCEFREFRNSIGLNP